MKKFTADFETATWNENETWVWAWAICDLENYNIKYGNNIDSFIDFCYSQNNPILYFHNLKFDGEFIIYWLFKNGYKHIENNKKEEIKDKTFTTLINEMGVFYSMTIYFKKRNKKVKKVTIYDSLKIIPLSVSEISKAFDIKEKKLEIDYNAVREKNHILTQEEQEYIKNDVLIVAKALNVLFTQELDRMTIGSNALNDYKKSIKKSKYERCFPQIDKLLDEELRKSYKGGFTYLSPEYAGKNIGKGTVLDVNSLYPSCLYYENFPIGEPIYYEGKYKDDKIYNLYIQVITCRFEIKQNKIPTIQIKNNSSYFRANEYLLNSKDEIVCLTLTSVDLKLFLEQYNVYDLDYIYGWKFKSVNGLFKDYIEKWITVKNKATLEKNKGLRTIAKLMLNSLYGKFATSLIAQSKNPYIDENDTIHYSLGEKEEKRGLYIPVGSFVTAYARNKTIRTSQSIMDYSLNKYGKNLYVYSDTDSIHCLLPEEELKQFCDIDDVELGKWKCEGKFTKARFLRQKCYIEEIDNKINITCAGLPKKCHENVTWKNFKIGNVFYGKLDPKHIKGGIVLKETEYTLKEL